MISKPPNARDRKKSQGKRHDCRECAKGELLASCSVELVEWNEQGEDALEKNPGNQQEENQAGRCDEGYHPRRTAGELFVAVF